MFLPIKSAAQVVADLVAEDDLIKPITKNIGQLTVIEYESYGMCVYSHLIIVGQKSNYELNNGCGGKMSDLENIAKTIKLI